MKRDELELLSFFVSIHGDPPDIKHREMMIESLGIPYKRAMFILEKWSKKGYWDYGVSTRTGWLTPEGIEWAGKYMPLTMTNIHL